MRQAEGSRGQDVLVTASETPALHGTAEGRNNDRRSIEGVEHGSRQNTGKWHGNSRSSG